ncbi:MAG: hypothetical protein Rhims3KO_00040 [Hyphomicrobiales bacterium]
MKVYSAVTSKGASACEAKMPKPQRSTNNRGGTMIDSARTPETVTTASFADSDVEVKHAIHINPAKATFA